MNVKLIRYTADPDGLASLAAAKCTNASNADKARDHAMASHHDSIMEHASFTFEVDDVSRVLLAQLTRHRLASFSVQSQRYCGGQSNFIMPASVRQRPELARLWRANLAGSWSLYEESIKQGVPMEDARYILKEGTTTALMLTMNARELMHFFSLRCCNRAQWEIRQMADEMLRQCRQVAPVLFADAGPGCLRGACPETRPCGNPRKRDEWNQ